MTYDVVNLLCNWSVHVEQWMGFMNFPAGSPGERSRANDSPGGGQGPQRGHCVSVFPLSLYNLILFFELRFHVLRVERKNNLLT